MIIDSSAIVGILRLEADARALADAIERAPVRRIAAPTLVETTMVMAGKKASAGLDILDAFLAESRIETIPFTADHATAAREAFLRFGKGRHPAGLNFGDCIAYAAARLEMMPLLFKGDDFRRTDVEAAM